MKKLFIITGEYSGDKHASCVAREIFKSNPDVTIEAVGGSNLETAGVKLFCNHEKMSAMGFNFKILVDHIMLGKKIANYLINDYKPDLVLLVDYGGFNLNIAKVLKKAGLKIYYYIPPQIWASRKWRINTVKRYIDKVITIFPFEIDMYRQAEVDAEFSGHPLVSQLPTVCSKEQLYEDFQLDKDKKLVSIFPGSRVFEIQNLLNLFIDASKIISESNPDTQFVICQAPTIKDELLQNIPENIKIIKNKNYELLANSDVLMLASGTVALEAALYGTPMIISYKGPEFIYWIYLLVRCIKRVSLPNIISNRDIVPELVQHLAKPQIIANHISELLSNEKKYDEMKKELENVKHFLTDKVSCEEAAKIILKGI